MGAVLLDTTVLIDLLRGCSGANARLAAVRLSGDTIHSSAINVEEVVRGLRSSEEEAARRLFDGLRIVPLDEREGRRAGAWRRELAARGLTIAQADCLIAAAAASVHGRVATGNPKDFPFEGLVIEHWPAGE
jgi:predicted nucleic acid-binding protein